MAADLFFLKSGINIIGSVFQTTGKNSSFQRAIPDCSKNETQCRAPGLESGDAHYRHLSSAGVMRTGGNDFNQHQGTLATLPPRAAGSPLR